MYILKIESSIKRYQSIKSETLSLKNIINKLDFLKKKCNVLSSWHTSFSV